jgi:hypothetical protein
MTMAGLFDNLHPALKSLWDLETELRRAAQNAIFLRNDEARQHMQQARRHYEEALKAIKGEASVPAQGSEPTKTPLTPPPEKHVSGPSGVVERLPPTDRPLAKPPI